MHVPVCARFVLILNETRKLTLSYDIVGTLVNILEEAMRALEANDADTDAVAGGARRADYARLVEESRLDNTTAASGRSRAGVFNGTLLY